MKSASESGYVHAVRTEDWCASGAAFEPKQDAVVLITLNSVRPGWTPI